MRRACGVNRWAGESSRKPRSPRPSPIIRASHTRRPTVFIATRRFGSAPQFLNRGAARHVATNAPDTRPSNRDAARHVATKTTCTNMTMWESTTGKGESRLDARVWWTGGRGNLRENREDPAPTVGIAGIPLRSKCRPIAATMRKPCAPHACRLWKPYGFYNDTARLWGCTALLLGRALAALGISLPSAQ